MFRLVLVSVLIVLIYGKGLYMGFKALQLEGRIVGGKNTTIEEHPYQVSLQINSKHFCGASLIKPDAIVTAAHCIHGQEHLLKSMTVRAGSTVREKGGEVANIRSMHKHPKYDHNASDAFDVCVLVLDRSFTINQAVRTIPLQPVNKEVPTGTLAWVTGWGALVSGGTPYTVLQKVDLPKIDQGVCKKSYPYEKIGDDMHCFGYLEGGKDTCQGDSGGPLVVDGKLVGIVSWGYGCGWEQLPGVYCKVAHREVQDHIKSVVGMYSKYP